jgi:hypothetical protein
MAVSQVSPSCTTPSPHRTEQSLSVVELQPLGQHASPAVHVSISVVMQRALQPSPAMRSRVHAMPSSQLEGHAPDVPAAIAVSHASPAPTTPSPHALVLESMVASEVTLASRSPRSMSWLHAARSSAAIARRVTFMLLTCVLAVDPLLRVLLRVIVLTQRAIDRGAEHARWVAALEARGLVAGAIGIDASERDHAQAFALFGELAARITTPMPIERVHRGLGVAAGERGAGEIEQRALLLRGRLWAARLRGL